MFLHWEYCKIKVGSTSGEITTPSAEEVLMSALRKIVLEMFAKSSARNMR